MMSPQLRLQVKRWINKQTPKYGSKKKHGNEIVSRLQTKFKERDEDDDIDCELTFAFVFI